MSCASVPTCKRSALVVGLLPPHLVERPRCPLNGLWVGDDQPAVPGEMAIHRDAVWLVLAVFCSNGAPSATKRFIASRWQSGSLIATREGRPKPPLRVIFRLQAGRPLQAPARAAS